MRTRTWWLISEFSSPRGNQSTYIPLSLNKKQPRIYLKCHRKHPK